MWKIQVWPKFDYSYQDLLPEFPQGLENLKNLEK